MKIQVASDLHLEHLKRAFPGERVISPAVGADILVLAGDIANGTDAIRSFGDWPTPVLYVMGNHEAYGEDIDDVRDSIAREAKGSAISFLERDSLTVAGVRFLGCTLWTDYSYRCGRTRKQLMDNARLRINDHKVIRRGAGLFTPEDALREHEDSCDWLRAELARPHAGQTVVVSHHAPHPLSIHPRYAGDPMNAAFSSDLGSLMRSVDLWIHGHTHDSFDYRVGRCRVVSNPLGYPRNLRAADTAPDLRFENGAFSKASVVELITPPEQDIARGA